MLDEREHQRRMLEARISTLERQVEFLLRVNGLSLSEMRKADDDVLLKMYQDAAHLVAIAPKPIDLETIARWAGWFIQISEYELTRLQLIVEFDHTWEPFLLLCIKLMTQVRQNKKLPESIQIQHLYSMLEKGRQNLRDAAIVMCHKYQDTLTDQTKILIRDNDLISRME